MPYKKSPEDATEWYMSTYCHQLGKDNMFCGCMKNKSFGNYCGKHKSKYLTDDGLIILLRYTKNNSDYNKTQLLNTLSHIYKTEDNYNIPIVKKYYDKEILKNDAKFTEYNPGKILPFLKKLKMSKEQLFTFANHLICVINNYEKYKGYFDKIDLIIKSQSYIRRFLIMNDNKYKGPAYLNKKKSCNEEDFFSFTPLVEIENEFFFSYKDKNDNIWSFDIRSLKKLIDMNQGNPYNRDKIPKKAKKRLLKRLIQLDNRKICTSIDKPMDEDIELYIKHRCIDVIQHVNQFGYHVEDTWILSLNLIRLKNLYAHLEDIWNYRAQLSNQVKLNICPPNGVVFNRSHAEINGITSKKTIQKILLDDIYKLVFSGINESDQKLGAMYFLIGLGKVNPICYQCIPWLQYV
jgi:hypothetical protein